MQEQRHRIARLLALRSRRINHLVLGRSEVSLSAFLQHIADVDDDPVLITGNVMPDPFFIESLSQALTEKPARLLN